MTQEPILDDAAAASSPGERSSSSPRLRFAPSPNGRLHLGHALSALLNERLARRLGGAVLLRIEDIDVTRCRPALEESMRADLAWLGLTWEEPVRRQSDHFADYRHAARRLYDQGLIYPCFCSRKDIGAAILPDGEAHRRDPDGAPLYPGTCRRLDPADRARIQAASDAQGRGRPLAPEDAPQAPLGQPADYCWRLDMEAALARAMTGGPLTYRRFDEDGTAAEVASDPGRWGDAVILRKEVPASYHLCVVHDDALQGITHVVRGADLEAATDLHVLLQRLLGLPTPLYHHHGLVRDEAGDKLAKSRGAPALADLRAEGVTPDAIRERLGFPRSIG